MNSEPKWTASSRKQCEKNDDLSELANRWDMRVFVAVNSPSMPALRGSIRPEDELPVDSDREERCPLQLVGV